MGRREGAFELHVKYLAGQPDNSGKMKHVGWYCNYTSNFLQHEEFSGTKDLQLNSFVATTGI